MASKLRQVVESRGTICTEKPFSLMPPTRHTADPVLVILRARAFDDSYGASQNSRGFERSIKMLVTGEREMVQSFTNTTKTGFPWRLRGKEPPAGAGDTGSIPGPGRSHRPRSNRARGPWPQLQSLRSGARGRRSWKHVPHVHAQATQSACPTATAATPMPPRAHAPRQQWPRPRRPEHMPHGNSGPRPRRPERMPHGNSAPAVRAPHCSSGGPALRSWRKARAAARPSTAKHKQINNLFKTTQHILTVTDQIQGWMRNVASVLRYAFFL